MDRKPIRSHEELEIYQLSFEAAMKIFEITKKFPREEIYSMTDQIRRSSRSVCANLTEAWRKRRYPAAFVSKLSDVETEAAETQTWLSFSFKCKYIEQNTFEEMSKMYDQIIGKAVTMINNPNPWILNSKK
ncbi:MAG: four helix bundle protein [Ignavibacteriales bacterium]|nr:four helix bundle protein [Ignavibacteriales bacterium]MBI3789030.1 four helix bundle protein [Ignavibacteriales bacterium]